MGLKTRNNQTFSHNVGLYKNGRGGAQVDKYKSFY